MGKYCVNCGKELHTGARFCAKCGAAVLDAPAKLAPVVQSKPAPQSQPTVKTQPQPRPATQTQKRPTRCAAKTKKYRSAEEKRRTQYAVHCVVRPARDTDRSGGALRLAGIYDRRWV